MARNAIQLAAVLATVLAGATGQASAGGGPATDIATLRSGFAEPPKQAGPWVYWFWYDNAVVKPELTRELEELAAAGFAGAEIRCVDAKWLKLSEGELERIGHKQLEYLSEDFLDALEHTCSEAKRLGLRLGINLGMGWPPGGPWVTKKYRSRKLLQASLVVGEATQEEILVPKQVGSAEMAFAWKLNDSGEKQVDPNSFQDLTGKLSSDQTRVKWQPTGGRWLIGFFRQALGGTLDKAQGWPADPGSAEAMRFHLDHFFGRVSPRLSKYFGSTLIDVATDSWEYHEGGGRPFWTPMTLNEFPKIAGYDLHSRLYAKLGYGPGAEEVQRDILRVEDELTQRNYFDLITRYANQHGLQHRPQPYGTGIHRDLFEAYAHCDVPEVEQGTAPTEAFWVAHALGKPIVSMETYTFLSGNNHLLGEFGRRFGAWEETPDLLRRHANLHFSRGVNRIQMHSFSYSPPGVPLPGWRMYAEIHLNRNVPWWPYVGELNHWLARNQFVLQAGTPVADALIYPVEAGEPYGTPRPEGQPRDSFNAVDALSRSLFLRLRTGGTNQDYVFGHLILSDDIAMVEEARQIARLCESGVKILCCTKMPKEWTVFGDKSPAQTATLTQLRDQLSRAEIAGQILDRRQAGWRKALDEFRSVRWRPGDASLTFQHRRVRGGEVYLLVNGSNTFAGEVSFPHSGLTPELWDADNGATRIAGRYRADGSRTHIWVNLPPFESRLVVFTDRPAKLHAVSAEGGSVHRLADNRLGIIFDSNGPCRVQLSDGDTREWTSVIPAPIILNNPWQLETDSRRGVGLGAPVHLRLDKLVSWRTLEPMRYFAGIATYETTFNFPEKLRRDDLGIVLELGQVHELARVWINDRLVGTAWIDPFELEVTPYLRAGTNTLRIEVPNLLKNQMEQTDKYTRPSGLLGPVRLRPFGHVSIEPGTNK